MPRNTFIDAIVNTSGYKILSKQLCGVALGLILVGFVWHLFDKSFSAPMCAGFFLLAILFFFKAFESVSETDNDVENVFFCDKGVFNLCQQNVLVVGISPYSINSVPYMPLAQLEDVADTGSVLIYNRISAEDA